MQTKIMSNHFKILIKIQSSNMHEQHKRIPYIPFLNSRATRLTIVSRNWAADELTNMETDWSDFLDNTVF